MDDTNSNQVLQDLANKVSDMKQEEANTPSNQPQNASAPESLPEFIDKLIEEKGFPDITQEVRDELKKDLLVRVDDFITARIIAALSDEDVKKFEEMLQQGKDQGEIQTFVSQQIPDFTNFLARTLLEFKGVYLGTIQAPINIEEESAPPPPSPAPVLDKN